MQNAMEQKLQFFKEIMELKSLNSSEQDFVSSVSEDVFKNTIYVFTPKGDVIELPYGATPIDFAYRVHSGVGDTMVGAIVNNNIVPLNYVMNYKMEILLRLIRIRILHHLVNGLIWRIHHKLRIRLEDILIR